MPSILVTGANGHLGRRFVATMTATHPVQALVRSERAKRQLERAVGKCDGLRISIGEPSDWRVVAEVGRDCERAVHLIGTIKETRHNLYRDTHERPVAALFEALPHTALKHIVYVSILGAELSSNSRCLRARAAVEARLLDATVTSTIIRVPMVLGEADRASAALTKRAHARHVLVFRGSALEQPIYAGDVIAALGNAVRSEPPTTGVFELAGPESISRRALIQRAAALVRREVEVHSLPLWCGMALAGSAELLLSRPPLTRDMLKIFDHDDAIDATPAARALGIDLTPLDEMLRRCVSSQATGR
jgi:NADH dehydrogenase (ubiquinone) 1 alpha subcomplex subunit 9